MAAEEKWYLSKEQLANTPSRKCGYDADKELSNRQQAANFIQDMGQRLQVTQLCINTAIVYMHRFYVYHSFSHFHRNAIATAALFLAAKVEEQPRKLEHVIKVGHVCLHRETAPLDTKSEGRMEDNTMFKPAVVLDDDDYHKDQEVSDPRSKPSCPEYLLSLPRPANYLEQAQELVFNENVLLQTLGFDVAIDHPHTHVVRCCHMVKDITEHVYACSMLEALSQHRLLRLAASKDLAQTSYFMASNSLHLTTMCLQYKPTVVACFCIHLACKWSNWEIPVSNEGKDWFYYVDKSVTFEQLETLTTEFLQIFDKCPTKLKRKIMSITATQTPMIPTHSAQPSQLFDNEPRKVVQDPHHRHPLLPSPSVDDAHRRPAPVAAATPHTPSKVLNLDVYRRKEKERVERESKHAQASAVPAREGHPKPAPPSTKYPSGPPGSRPIPSGVPLRPEFGRTTVTASRDLARREQAQARELTKQRDSQQSSIFSPPTKHEVAPDSQPDAASNHLNSLTSVNKNSSQEWQETLNHNNELETNRHNSDKYNLVNKDSRQMDPKRLHSKDQRLPVPKDGQKLSLEDSQRMYKYNHRKGEDEAKRPPDTDHPQKQRPSFGQAAAPPPPKVAPRPANGGAKPSVPSGHHPGASKSQHHRVPSPVVQGRQPPGQHRSSSSQNRGNSPFVPKPAANPKLENIDIKVQKSVHATPVKVDPRNGHPIERREVNHRQPESVKQQEVVVKQEPGVVVKQEPAVHREQIPFRIDAVKQEVVPRLDMVKQEPTERRQEAPHKSQADAGRVLAGILRAAELPQKLMEIPIKTESDTFSASSSQPTPKSSASSSRSQSKSSVSGPNVNSSSSSNRESHAPRPSKPSTRHPVPPPAPKKQYPEMMSLPPIASPEFGSPPPPVPNTPTKNVPTTPGYSSRSHNRNRTSSSSSEPELVPYVTKLEEIAGYENILESKKGIKLDKLPLPGRVPDMIQPIRDRVKEESHSGHSSRSSVNLVSKELRTPDLIKPFATVAPVIPSHAKSVDVGAIAFPAEDSDPTNVFIKSDSSLPGIIDVVNVNETESIKTIIEPGKLMPLGIALDVVPSKSDHPHKSEKKKKKEKHKHKDKDKNKDREERKHKRKHKDKDKEKHREKDKELLNNSALLTAPIKITIPKERLTQSTIDKNPPQVLKFKIQKPASSPQSTPGGELKLKISRNTIVEGFSTPPPSKESRKRDRSASKAADESLRPPKAARVDSKKGSPSYVKHNGVRGQHHKVSSVQPAVSLETGRGSKGGGQPL